MLALPGSSKNTKRVMMMMTTTTMMMMMITLFLLRVLNRVTVKVEGNLVTDKLSTEWKYNLNIV